jgi:hypothetical protein
MEFSRFLWNVFTSEPSVRKAIAGFTFLMNRVAIKKWGDDYNSPILINLDEVAHLKIELTGCWPCPLQGIVKGPVQQFTSMELVHNVYTPGGLRRLARNP